MPGIDFDRLRKEITMQQVLDATWLPVHPWPRRSVVRPLPLAWLSPEQTILLLREREPGPVLLPSLPSSRPSDRTLGSGHWSTTVSSGHRPLRHVGARRALGSPLVIDGRQPWHETTELCPDASNGGTEKRPSVLAVSHHATVCPSMIVLRSPSFIVLALRRERPRLVLKGVAGSHSRPAGGREAESSRVKSAAHFPSQSEGPVAQPAFARRD